MSQINTPAKRVLEYTPLPPDTCLLQRLQTMRLIIFALRRPLSVMVAMVAVSLGCVLAIRQMPVDIFPSLNLPVIYVAQPFGGILSAVRSLPGNRSLQLVDNGRLRRRGGR